MGRRRTRLIVGANSSPLAVADVADRPWTRLIGLLGRSRLDQGRGLVIEPCAGVHQALIVRMEPA